MPVAMSFSPAFKGVSPRVNGNGTGIENGNKLGCRPVVRQSKLYREKESGNAMKELFGQENLQWRTEEQEGVFQGQGVYDAANEAPAQQRSLQATGAAGQSGEIEYPLPGSVASCDACGNVVNRYYHCQDCQEQTGLFDLCTECCAAIYLKQGSPRALASCQPPSHPTHQYASHRMTHIRPE